MIAQVCPSVNPSARIYYIFARNFYIKRLNHFSCGIGVKQGVRGSVRTGRAYPEFCVTTKKRYKIELIFQGGSGAGCARLVYNITPTGAEVKGRPYSFIEASPAA